jgi:glycosyltransferase involved in cell wall biosynthesis
MLERALLSVANQTRSANEIIVIDDSTDIACRKKNKRLCEKFGGRWCPTIENLKLGGRTLNFCVQEAACPYIAFLDDDDVWLPQKIEKQISLLEDNRQLALITCSQQNIFMKDGIMDRRLGTIFRGEIPPYRKLLNFAGKYLGPPSAVLVSKQAIVELGGFDEKILRGPCQLMFRQIARDYQVAACREPLLEYLVHEQNITHNFGVKPYSSDIKARLHKLRALQSDFERHFISKLLEEWQILKLSSYLTHTELDKLSGDFKITKTTMPFALLKSKLIFGILKNVARSLRKVKIFVRF